MSMADDLIVSNKKCYICKGGKKNNTIHWHQNPDNGEIWLYCVGKCQQAYSLREYCKITGLTIPQLMHGGFDFKESPPNEVRKMEWPSSFIPLFDQRAKPGVAYLKSRGIDLDDGMYYDLQREGIVFPYFYEQAFVGAQIRFLKNFIDYDGTERKIDTLPGTRLGLLFYDWNQSPMMPNIKGVIVTEGAFNSKCISQALNHVYGSIFKNPWKCIAASGSGASKHQIDTIRELKESGLKIVVAPDSDEAGQKMFEKFVKAEATTHFVFTEDSERDWNDIGKTMSKEEFAKWFLGRIKSVGRS